MSLGVRDTDPIVSKRELDIDLLESFIRSGMKYVLNNQDDTDYQNTIDSAKLPFEAIKRIYQQDFYESLLEENTMKLYNLIKVNNTQPTIGSITFPTNDVTIDINSGWLPLEAKRTIEEKLGGSNSPFSIGRTHFHTVIEFTDAVNKRNQGLYDDPSFIEDNTDISEGIDPLYRFFTSGLLEQVFEEESAAFKDDIYKEKRMVYFQTIARRIIELFARLSNTRLSTIFYTDDRPVYPKEVAVAALDIFYNLLSRISEARRINFNDFKLKDSPVKPPYPPEPKKGSGRPQKVRVLFGIDTTISMKNILASVRKKASDMIDEIFKRCPECEIGFCQYSKMYKDDNKGWINDPGFVNKANKSQITNFINNYVKFVGTGDTNNYQTNEHWDRFFEHGITSAKANKRWNGNGTTTNVNYDVPVKIAVLISDEPCDNYCSVSSTNTDPNNILKYAWDGSGWMTTRYMQFNNKSAKNNKGDNNPRSTHISNDSFVEAFNSRGISFYHIYTSSGTGDASVVNKYNARIKSHLVDKINGSYQSILSNNATNIGQKISDAIVSRIQKAKDEIDKIIDDNYKKEYAKWVAECKRIDDEYERQAALSGVYSTSLEYARAAYNNAISEDLMRPSLFVRTLVDIMGQWAYCKKNSTNPSNEYNDARNNWQTIENRVTSVVETTYGDSISQASWFARSQHGTTSFDTYEPNYTDEGTGPFTVTDQDKLLNHFVFSDTRGYIDSFTGIHLQLLNNQEHFVDNLPVYGETDRYKLTSVQISNYLKQGLYALADAFSECFKDPEILKFLKMNTTDGNLVDPSDAVAYLWGGIGGNMTTGGVNDRTKVDGHNIGELQYAIMLERIINKVYACLGVKYNSFSLTNNPVLNLDFGLRYLTDKCIQTNDVEAFRKTYSDSASYAKYIKSKLPTDPTDPTVFGLTSDERTFISHLIDMLYQEVEIIDPDSDSPTPTKILEERLAFKYQQEEWSLCPYRAFNKGEEKPTGIYTIIYNPNGATHGSTVEQQVTTGEEFNLLGNSFTRIGYNFVGWWLAYESKQFDANQHITEDLGDAGEVIYLDAMWERDERIPLPPETTYTIIFDSNNKTGKISEQLVEEHETVQLNANNFKYYKHKFVNWELKGEPSIIYSDGASVTNLASVGETVRLYAVWEKDESQEDSNPPQIYQKYPIFDTASESPSAVDDEPVVMKATNKQRFYVLTYDAEDADLTYNWAKDGIDINITGNMWDWTPGSSDVGTHTISVTCSDGLHEVSTYWNVSIEPAAEVLEDRVGVVKTVQYDQETHICEFSTDYSTNEDVPVKWPGLTEPLQGCTALSVLETYVDYEKDDSSDDVKVKFKEGITDFPPEIKTKLTKIPCICPVSRVVKSILDKLDTTSSISTEDVHNYLNTLFKFDSNGNPVFTAKRSDGDVGYFGKDEEAHDLQPGTAVNNAVSYYNQEHAPMHLAYLDHLIHLCQILYKVNHYITYNETYAKVYVTDSSNYIYGDSVNGSYEPISAFRFSNFHANNRKASGKRKDNQTDKRLKIYSRTDSAVDHLYVKTINRDLSGDGDEMLDRQSTKIKTVKYYGTDIPITDETGQPIGEVNNSNITQGIITELVNYKSGNIELYKINRLNTVNSSNFKNSLATFEVFVKRFRPMYLPQPEDLYATDEMDKDVLKPVTGWSIIPHKGTSDCHFNENVIIIPMNMMSHNSPRSRWFHELDLDFWEARINSQNGRLEKGAYLTKNTSGVIQDCLTSIVKDRSAKKSYEWEDKNYYYYRDWLFVASYKKNLMVNSGQAALQKLPDPMSDIDEGDSRLIYQNKYIQGRAGDLDNGGLQITSGNLSYFDDTPMGDNDTDRDIKITDHALNTNKAFSLTATWLYITIPGEGDGKMHTSYVTDICPFFFWHSSRGSLGAGPSNFCYGLSTLTASGAGTGNYDKEFSEIGTVDGNGGMRLHAVGAVLAQNPVTDPESQYKGAYDPVSCGTNNRWHLHGSAYYGVPNNGTDGIKNYDRYWNPLTVSKSTTNIGSFRSGNDEYKESSSEDVYKFGGIFKNTEYESSLRNAMDHPLTWSLWNVVRHGIWYEYNVKDLEYVAGFEENRATIEVKPTAEELDEMTFKTMKAMYQEWYDRFTYNGNYADRHHVSDNGSWPNKWRYEYNQQGEPIAAEDLPDTWIQAQTLDCNTTKVIDSSKAPGGRCYTEWTNVILAIEFIYNEVSDTHNSMLCFYTGSRHFTTATPTSGNVADEFRGTPREENGINFGSGIGDVRFSTSNAQAFRYCLPRVDMCRNQLGMIYGGYNSPVPVAAYNNNDRGSYWRYQIRSSLPKSMILPLKIKFVNDNGGNKKIEASSDLEQDVSCVNTYLKNIYPPTEENDTEGCDMNEYNKRLTPAYPNWCDLHDSGGHPKDPNSVTKEDLKQITFCCVPILYWDEHMNGNNGGAQMGERMFAFRIDGILLGGLVNQTGGKSAVTEYVDTVASTTITLRSDNPGLTYPPGGKPWGQGAINDLNRNMDYTNQPY